MKHIVKLSGGKDSLAVAVQVATALAVRATQQEFEMVFCDTGWEHPDTYAYLDRLEAKFGQKVIRVKSKKYPDGFRQMVGGKNASRHAMPGFARSTSRCSLASTTCWSKPTT